MPSRVSRSVHPSTPLTQRRPRISLTVNADNLQIVKVSGILDRIVLEEAQKFQAFAEPETVTEHLNDLKVVGIDGEGDSRTTLRSRGFHLPQREHLYRTLCSASCRQVHPRHPQSPSRSRSLDYPGRWIQLVDLLPRRLDPLMPPPRLVHPLLRW
jgi:hypothetical protein